MHVSALVSSYDGSCGVELWVDSLEAYERVLPHKAAFESRWLQEAGTQVKWDDPRRRKEIASRSGADHRGLRRGRLKHDLSVDRQLDAQNPRARDGGERYVAART